MSGYAGKRSAAWLACAMSSLAALITLAWRPDEAAVDKANSAVKAAVAPGPKDAGDAEQQRKDVGGITYVKIDLSEVEGGQSPKQEGLASPGPQTRCGKLARSLHKGWLFMLWLGKHGIYPLLTLNFVFRFAFSVYKTVFAYFCFYAAGYGPKGVGYLLSGMGVASILVQGVVVRVVVTRLGEERTLLLAMVCTSLGFVGLSFAKSLLMLLLPLGCIAIGYNLAVPCLSTLFSHVPVQQGVMQGIAGSIDRFGQALGPVLGGAMLTLLGNSGLLAATGSGLAATSLLCLVFIGDGCVSWFADACKRKDGYSPLGGSDEATETTELCAVEDGSTEVLEENGAPSPPRPVAAVAPN